MTCKDCVHCDVCEYLPQDTDENDVFEMCAKGRQDEIPNMENRCIDFKDKSRFIELPCNVGDTVFITEQGEIAEHRVSCIDIGFLGFGITTRCVIECRIDDPCAAAINICRTHYDQREIGEKIFMTREEAEKVLKER